MTTDRPRLLRWLSGFAFGSAALGLCAWLVAGSWMRWMDPQIDLGHELYVPWRILQGGHLGVDTIQAYGPLSDYLNAGLFALFGTSVRTLVIANLVVFAGIVLLLHRVLVAAFGAAAGGLATLGTIAVFGFGHYVGTGNYTYAMPYAHEATHGMALLLVLLNSLLAPSALRLPRGMAVGVVLGLLALTKTEVILTAVALFVTAVLLARADGTGSPRAFLAGALAGLLATLGMAWGLLALATNPPNAVRLVASAGLAPLLFPSYTAGTHVLSFLGWDAPGESLAVMGKATAAMLIGVTVLGVIGRFADRASSRVSRTLLMAVACLGLLVAATELRWLLAGSAFPPALLIIGGFVVVRARGAQQGLMPPTPSARAAVLLWVAAVVMLARMALAPRLFHYGFFQAMLAGAFLMGFLIRELPRLLARERGGRVGLTGALVLFLALGAFDLVRQSQAVYAFKTVPVGEGADRIYGLRPDIAPGAAMLERARSFLLRENLPAEATLLVVPEGNLLNYLLRRRQPIAVTDLLPPTLKLAGDVLPALQKSPPDYVVVVPRPMLEMGHAFFGSDAASGQDIAAWLDRGYERKLQIGAAPFQSAQPGLTVLRRR